MTAPGSPPDPWQPAQPVHDPYGQVWGQPYGPPTPWTQGTYGPPGSPPAQLSTNGWAITSLVTGVLPLPPVAIVTAVVGLVQTRRRRQPGHGLAVAGLVLGLLWAVAIGGLVTGALMGAFDSSSTLGTVAQAGSTTVGACLEVPDSGRSTVADCAVPHDGEVYFVGGLGADGWPGNSEVGDRADSACYDHFAGYVGESYDDSSLDYAQYVPDRREWDAGERRVVCVVEPGDADTLTGSVRGRERGSSAAFSRRP